MKITKEQLKQIIKEELEAFKETLTKKDKKKKEELEKELDVIHHK
tara:strand:+ start:328 stop:462 length:135 start_codon:yes stop_codon:yes gene_type:complete